MRLKQLLVFLLPLVMFSAAAHASAPQLIDVSAVGQGNTSTVTLHTSGAFTHNEYRPNEDLLLVDLVGVSAGKLDNSSRVLQGPGLASYRVVGYSGAGGVPVARFELRLRAHSEVRVNPSGNGLIINVVSSAEAAVAPAPTLPAAPPSPGAQQAAQPAPRRRSPRAGGSSSAQAGFPASPSAGPVQVRNVAIFPDVNSVLVEISASGPLHPRTMKLVGPDRIVVDLANAVPAAGRARIIPVNASGVMAVRTGRFRSSPPVTRVVVDLASPRDFDLAQEGNKVSLKLRPVGAAASLQPAAAFPAAERKPAPLPPALAGGVVAQPAKAAGVSVPPFPKDINPPAKDFVVVQPKFQEHVSEQNPNSEMAQVAPPSSTPATPKPATAPPTATPATPQPTAPKASAAQSQAAVNFAADQLRADQNSSATRTRYTGELISVNLKDVDLKDFFRLIHEISGLNVVLDPSVAGSLTLVLDDVPWDQALDVVLKNNGLDRQLEGNVLRIAKVDTLRTEAEARRRQVEAQMLAVDRVTVTRFLSYAHSKDVLPTVKKLLSARGDIVADERTNGLIISDVPSVIPPIDILLKQLDRKTQEVEIEARVIAATRTFAREIGTQLGFEFFNSATLVTGAPNVGFSPNLGIPLFSDLHAVGPSSGVSVVNNGSRYSLDAVLTMAEKRGLLKILSRPRVITQNNILAIVKQGLRVPITTQAQLQGPPTVTYVEAVLRLTVTPQITAENTIFLNVDIENTSPDFSNKIFGNPVFLTQQATTQVLVTNGGTVVIGGVIQSQNSLNIQQVPLLGSIPVLGNLFKRRGVDTSTQELIFFITPRIVET